MEASNKVISYKLGNSGQTLILVDEVIEHFVANRQVRQSSAEAGGQLFARIEESIITVKRATGPRKSDKRSLFSFIPDRLAERREIKQLFKSGLHYVGDWHTHPEKIPYPSATDSDSFSDMFRNSTHQLEGFVMVIVGQALPPKGLYVAVCNGDIFTQLVPEEVLAV